MMDSLKFSVWTLVILMGATAVAQEDKQDVTGGNVGSEMGFHVGRLLPDQINGLTEIISGWGVRYGMKTSRGFIELGGNFHSGEGSTYNTLSVSMRGDIPVESLVAEVFAGFDLAQISTPLMGESSYVGGGHVGGGIMALIGGDVWFRSDMKFNINPGTSLYIGFGFEIRFAEGGAGGSR
jgi:hypothetical protein